VPAAARGVRWDDPTLAIKWPQAERRMISARDQAWPDYRPVVLDVGGEDPSSPTSASRSAARLTVA
jgi:hypothetical protein